MNLAGGNITLYVEGKAVGILPTLRRAMLLQHIRGLQALARDISEGSLTGALAIVSLVDDRPDLGEIILRDGISKNQAAMTLFVLALMGIDPDEPQKTPAKGKGATKTPSVDEFLSGLYRIGTGWLGWTPDTTLDATIAQLMEAHAGKIDMLKAVYGGGDDKAEDKGPWDRNVRKIFGGHQIIKVTEGGDNVG